MPRFSTPLEGFVPFPDDVRERYVARGHWTGEPLDHMLRRAAERSPERRALVSGERIVSFAELDARVDRLAAALHGLGLRARDRVVVQLPNVPEFVELCFALFRLGVIPVLALPGHRRSEIGYFCAHAEAAAYVTCDVWGGFDYRALAREVLADAPNPLRVIVLGDAQEFTPLTSLDDEPLDLAPIEASEVALLQLSGGSTGTPKLIPRTHDDYLYSVRESARICQLSPESRYLVALPIAHNFLLSSPGLLGCLWAGATVILSPIVDADVVFPLLQRHEVTLTAAVPSLAQLWLSAARARGLHFPRLTLQVGGAKLSETVARALLEGLGCRLQQVFGMAEGLVNYTRADDPLELVVTTQGRPISSDDEIRVVDDEDVDVPDGHVGHLLTRGPYTIRGYYRAAEYNSLAFTRDGYYRTGDLVRRGELGSLIVEGRAKEQINRGGEKIAPVELEEHLLAHPDIQDVAVLGAPDPLLGERICAFVVPRGDARPNKAHILAHLRARGVAVFKMPDRVELRPELPKTSAGKTDKKALAHHFAARPAP